MTKWSIYGGSKSMENQEKPNGNRKFIFGLLIFFVLVGLAGGGWWWYMSTKYVSTDDAHIDGTIVSVSSKIPGKVTEVLVKEGDHVKVGQVIARIDSREIKDQKLEAEMALAAAKANYEELLHGSRPQEIGKANAGVLEAQAGVEKARANLENAEKNYTRLEKLYKDGAVSTAQRDNAEASYREAREAVNAAMGGADAAGQLLDLVKTGSREEQIRAAEAKVKEAQAALDRMKVVNGYTNIVCPVDGIVALKSVNPGEVVNAGQPLFSVTQTSDVWVTAKIEETSIGEVKVGQKVDYTIDAYPGQTFEGTVTEIGSAANSVFALIPTENSSNTYTKVTQRIPIKISLPHDTKYVFRPGMSVVVRIHVK
jgi:multidrug resistance efflux pump